MSGEFFSFGNKSKTPEAPPIGYESAGTPAAHIRAEAAKTVESEIAVSTARRGRPSKSAGNSGLDNRALQAKINEQIESQLEGLHAPEAWEALLCVPADAALTLTGNKRWELEKNERKTLGVTGSAAARTMMITNPRALAFFMLGSAMFSVYLPRAIGQLKDMREEAEKKAKEKKDAPHA